MRSLLDPVGPPQTKTAGIQYTVTSPSRGRSDADRLVFNFPSKPAPPPPRRPFDWERDRWEW